MKTQGNFLFVTLDGGGNLPPVLGLARRLAARGHRIRVLTEPCLEKTILDQGLHFIPFEKQFTRTDRNEDIFRDWNASPLEPDPSIEGIVLGPAEPVISETLRALDQEQTDVLVVDVLLLPALIAAEARGVSRVVLFHMPEYMPGANRPPGGMGLLPGRGPIGKWRDRLLGKLFQMVVNKYRGRINRVRTELDLSPLSNVADLFHQADLRIIQTLRNFDFPLEPTPANVRYTGPVLDDPDWIQPWENPWSSDDERPLVVVGFSSTFQNQAQTVQRCIEALAKLDVRGLVTLGPALDPGIFTAPPHVVVVDSAPHSAVFPQADLVVTHAGHGTIMRALAHGLPMVCLPMGRDQRDNAAKVAFHGCGLRLHPKASTSTIHKAIFTVLKEERFKQQATRLQGEVIREAPQDRDVLELENLFVKTSSLPSVHGPFRFG